MFSLTNSAVNMALPAFAAERRAAAPCCGAVAAGLPAPAAVDRYLCPRGAQQQTRRKPLPRSNDGTDRRTDGNPTVIYTLLAYYESTANNHDDHGDDNTFT